jgi:hypothetical protein
MGGIGVPNLLRPERVQTSAWCSCRRPVSETQCRAACEWPVNNGSAPSFGKGTNQRCEVCEGLVQVGKTGISEMLSAVLEPYAGKARTYGSSGAAFSGGNAATHYGTGDTSMPMGLPKAELMLSEDVRSRLTSIARSRSIAAAMVTRDRIVRAAAAVQSVVRFNAGCRCVCFKCLTIDCTSRQIQ